MFDVDNEWVYGKNKNWKTRFETNVTNSLPVISGITVNNGVNYYTTDIPDKTEVFKDSLTISTRGEYSGTVTYHKGEFLLANNILVMNMPELTLKQKLFIGALINSLPYGGYSGYPRKETLKDDVIKLPIKDGKIDFNFMKSLISELEEERISELSAYLKVSRLESYELSDKEKQALERLPNIKWKEYNLEKLCGKATRGRRLKSQDRIKGVLPFVTAGEANTGISDFIGNDVKVFGKNTITIDMFGSAKYRNYNYGCDDHIAVVHTENLKMEESIFITSAIHKTSYNGQFNYGRNFYAKDADTLNILLPINEKGIDYDFMNSLISAVQKLVIKDVVIYADEKIKATKKVVRKD